MANKFKTIVSVVNKEDKKSFKKWLKDEFLFGNKLDFTINTQKDFIKMLQKAFCAGIKYERKIWTSD
jgi:hypothetical protein